VAGTHRVVKRREKVFLIYPIKFRFFDVVKLENLLGTGKETGRLKESLQRPFDHEGCGRAQWSGRSFGKLNVLTWEKGKERPYVSGKRQTGTEFTLDSRLLIGRREGEGEILPASPRGGGSSEQSSVAASFRPSMDSPGKGGDFPTLKRKREVRQNFRC